MIPYVDIRPVRLGSMLIDIEELLTTVGVLLAVVLARQRARRLGVDVSRLDSFLIWVLIGSLAGGHFSDVLLYRLDDVVTISGWHVDWVDRWEIFRLWHGWRSVGGFFGGIGAALLWGRYSFRFDRWFILPDGALELEGYRFVRRIRPERILDLAEVVLAVFPVAWTFKRMGSVLVHDRPGTRASSEALLSVDYPALVGSMIDGAGAFRDRVPRYDLGLLELVLTVGLLVLTIALWRKASRSGVFVWLVGFAYPPGRVAIEFLARTTGPHAPPRFYGGTPTQWGFGALSMLVVFALTRVLRGE